MASTAPFTPQQIASVNTGTPAPSISKVDLNAPAPVPTPVSQSNPISDYLGRVGNDFSSAIKEGSQSETASIQGKENPLMAGLDIAKVATTGAISPITEALAPVMDKTVSPFIKTVSDGLSNVKSVQDFAQFASKFPTIGKAINDLTQTGLNVAGFAGGDAVASKVGETASSIADNLSKPSETTATPVDTLSSRIKDATPNYSEKMIGTNVKTPTGDISPRIASEGQGLKGVRPVTTSASESAAGTELNNIKDYPDKGTNLEKGLAIDKSLSSEAEGMRASLQAEDKANPLDVNAEKSKVIDMVKLNLPEDIREKMGILSPEDQAYMQDMQERLGVKSPPEGFDTSASKIKLPKTAAGRYFGKVGEALNNYDGTREGKLDLRQNIDSAYKEARGKLAFGSDSQNELDETNTDIRNALNKDLARSTKNTDTTASLKKQSNLYNARDVIYNKAKEESDTSFGRLEQKYPMLKQTLRIAQRQGVYIPLRLVEAGIGITALTAFLKSKMK